MCVELKTTQSPTERPTTMDLRPKSTNNLEFWISKGWYVSSTSQTLPHNKLYWFWMCKFLPGMFKICHTCHLYLQKLEVMLETDELDARDENSICFGSKFISPLLKIGYFFQKRLVLWLGASSIALWIVISSCTGQPIGTTVARASLLFLDNITLSCSSYIVL